MKKILAAVVVIAIAAGAFHLMRTKKKEPVIETIQMKVADIQIGPIVRAVEASGVVKSNLDVEIKCKASGEIITLPYDVSDYVEKGTLLLQLDPEDENRNVAKAELAVASARARVEKAEKNLSINIQKLKNDKRSATATLEAAKVKTEDSKSKAQRIKDLYSKKLASEEELSSANALVAQSDAELERARVAIDELKSQETSLELNRQDVLVARSDLESAMISLEIARRRLADTRVYAPVSGVVTSRTVQTGQIISSATSNVGGGTTIMTISDLSKLYITASVDESDIGQVRIGQTVEITADAYPGRIFNGRVDRVAPQGKAVSNVVTFDVRIEVLEDEGDRGGAFAMGGREMGSPERGDVNDKAREWKKREDAPARDVSGERSEKAKRKEEKRAWKKRNNENGFAPRAAEDANIESARPEPGAWKSNKKTDAQNPSQGMGEVGMKTSLLKPEMTTNVKIIIESKDSVMMIPLEAISRAKGKASVKVVKGGATPPDEKGAVPTEDREVEIGINDGTNVEVVSGLKKNEKVQYEEGAMESGWSRGGNRMRGMGGGGGRGGRPMMMH